MNFKSIELLGFKSFADKLKISFDNGVTCIVGPNGCGKSNVADAIKWVLGEQSAKSLRGGNMQDVIFSGTQARKSLSYCEVSLIFDNSEKLFDLEYDEVIFTRKLYRSGESEYQINRQSCRLKDIVHLLHSIGIGKDGYSIIGQNKISEIMNAKPDERRSIFEEATGISIFKSKKAEIERKLTNSTDNLSRYTDIISEVENQLSPLSKQAENARLYFNYAEELKSHEINTYLYKYENAASEKNKINTRLNALNEEINDKKSAFTKAQSDYSEAFEKQQSIDGVLYDYQEKLREKEVGLEKLQGQNKIYSERLNALKSEKIRNEGEIVYGKERLVEIDNEIINKKQHITSLETDYKLADENIIKCNSELTELTEKIMIYEKTAQLSQEKMIDSIESLAKINSDVSGISAEKQAISERQKEITDKLSELSFRKSELETNLEITKTEITDLIDKQTQLKENITNTNNALNITNKDIYENDNRIYAENSRYSTFEANHRMLLGLKESFEGYNYSVKRLLTSAKQNPDISDKILGVIADIINSEQKYEVAIETSVGGAMQNIVTKDADDARYLIQFLKRTQGGMVTFLPVKSIKPRFENNTIKSACNEKGALGLAYNLINYDPYYENVIKFLLGNTLICDDINSAVAIAKKYNNSFKIVTLEGDIINSSGSMTGGYKKHGSSNLLSSERKIAKVLEDLEASKINLEKLKNKKNQLLELKDKNIALSETLNNDYNHLSQKIVALKAKYDNIELAYTDSENEISALKDRNNIIAERLEKLMFMYNSSFEGTQKAKKTKSQITSELEKNKQEYENLKSRHTTLTEKSSKFQLKLNTISMTKDACLNDIERLNNEKQEIDKKIKELTYKNDGNDFSIKELKTSVEKSELKGDEQTEINALRENVQRISEEKKQLNISLSSLNEIKNTLSDELEKLSEKKYSSELSLSKVDSELDAMRERIWEEYQATYEGSINLKIPDYNLSQGKAEITKLKKQITALGNINYNAIEDFKSLNDRYDDMLIQKEDLEKAHKDLTVVLVDLRKEMQKKFDEGFSVINDNFKTVFKELFGGGRAELQLDYTDCIDPLNAGIEIVAEPPGKKLQKLSLLSGGEQALTAIAILFSILKMRAMPFCVLDEIEAALDEANVDRFAKYLKNFSKETQFIVITHRKPTMELADYLYGVTMEEKGVSKMVSVKLSDIENQLDIA